MLCVDLQMKKVMFVLMNKAAEFFFLKNTTRLKSGLCCRLSFGYY